MREFPAVNPAAEPRAFGARTRFGDARMIPSYAVGIARGTIERMASARGRHTEGRGTGRDEHARPHRRSIRSDFNNHSIFRSQEAQCLELAGLEPRRLS